MQPCWHSNKSLQTGDRRKYAHLRATLDAQLFADLDERADAFAEAGLPEVVPEDAGRARVREDVGVALVQVLAGEGPVVECGACVVVLDECNGARGPHAQHAGRPPLAVYQPPVLASPHGLLQYACAHILCLSRKRIECTFAMHPDWHALASTPSS